MRLVNWMCNSHAYGPLQKLGWEKQRFDPANARISFTDLDIG